KTFAQLLATPRLSLKDQFKLEDLKLKREKISSADQAKIDKLTDKFYTETIKASKDARDNDMRLNKMKVLNDSGKLTSPVYASLLNALEHGIFGFGLNLKGTLNPESQEFEKLSTDFLKNAKTYFGNRMTQQEVQLFLKTIPQLSMSKQARDR